MSAWKPTGAGPSRLGQAALWYAEHKGWHVFPCRRDKTPYTPHGWHDATVDADTIRGWWRRWPGASVGIACAASGLVLIDEDPRNGSDDTMHALRCGGDETLPHLGVLPHTITALSGGGGTHSYFRYPASLAPGLKFKGKLGPGVDVLALDYVIAPPSPHPSGRTYAWEASSRPEETELADLPDTWLRAAVKEVAQGATFKPGSTPASESLLGLAFGYADMLGRDAGQGRVTVVCPWAHEHSSGTNHDSSTVLFPPTEGKTLGWFHCSHSHCEGRTPRDVLAALPDEAVFQAEQNIAARAAEQAAAPPPMAEASEGQQQVADAIRNAAAGLTLIRCTVGLGKTHALHDAIAASGASAAVFVTSHRLADEHADRLGQRGVDAVAKKGVTSIRLALVTDGRAGEKACLDAERAEALSVLGAKPREVLCPFCPHRDKHPTAPGGACPGYLAMTEKAEVNIFQNSIAGEVLGNLADAILDEGRDDPPVTLAVLDEPPPLLDTVALDRATPDEVQGEKELLQEETRERLDHLWSLVRRALAPGAGLLPGMSLRRLAILGAEGDETAAESAIAWARDLPAVRWPSAIHHRLAGATGPGVTAWQGRLVRTARVLGALLEATHRPDAPLFAVDERSGEASLVHVGRWAREAARFGEAGGRTVVLDATADPAAWAAAGLSPLVSSVDVRDAATVNRRWFYWGSAARGRHVGADGQVNPTEVRGCLRAFADVLRDTGARTAGLITDKPTAEALRRELAQIALGAESSAELTLIPHELAQLLGAGGCALEIGHFGAVRGVNAWEAVDVLGVLGEDWANLGSTWAEADALGLDRACYAKRRLHAELTQAEGRARCVRRTGPLTLVRFSKVAPDLAMAPQWFGVKGELLTMGRPRKVDASGQKVDASGWAAERAAAGGISKREHARRLGLVLATYQAAEKRAGGVTGKSYRSDQSEGQPANEANTTPETSVTGLSGHLADEETSANTGPPWRREPETSPPGPSPQPTSKERESPAATPLPGAVGGSPLPPSDTWAAQRRTLGLSPAEHAAALHLPPSTYHRLEALAASLQGASGRSRGAATGTEDPRPR